MKLKEGRRNVQLQNKLNWSITVMLRNTLIKVIRTFVILK
nr:MAG TPA: hypothetical protein [Bacteriophage sp.]DAQ87997.1 MAG TPA: hypothetical protein [Caudoviricetes sp.]